MCEKHPDYEGTATKPVTPCVNCWLRWLAHHEKVSASDIMEIVLAVRTEYMSMIGEVRNEIDRPSAQSCETGA
jgi:hypothetical protein